MKRILVTGATSMIGTALIQVAVREGTEVYAIVRPGTKRMERLPQHPQVHTVFGGLESLLDIQGLPDQCDCFYHLAWDGTKRSVRDDPQVHERNIRYTLDAVELAKKTGCKRFVGAGSQAEYGPVADKIDENTKFAPVTSYGIAKYASCILSGKRCEQLGIEHIWGRIFSVYGPHDNEGTMLNTAVDNFLAGRTAHFSAASHMWNYLYESDAGEMFYRLGQEKCRPGVCLIANNESRVLKDYILELADLFGPEASCEFDKTAIVPLSGLNVDMRSSCEKLDYIPVVSFRDGILETINARRNMQISGSLSY